MSGIQNLNREGRAPPKLPCEMLYVFLLGYSSLIRDDDDDDDFYFK